MYSVGRLIDVTSDRSMIVDFILVLIILEYK